VHVVLCAYAVKFVFSYLVQECATKTRLETGVCRSCTRNETRLAAFPGIMDAHRPQGGPWILELALLAAAFERHTQDARAHLIMAL